MKITSALYFKQLHKKWWFWVLIIFVIALLISLDYVLGYHKLPEKTNVNTNQIVLSEKEYKKSCKTIDYRTLVRNPNKHKGENFKFTGKVYTVKKQKSKTEDETTYNMRVEVTKDEFGFWDDIICATVDISDKADKILEDDIITFWGECDGEYIDKRFSGTYEYPIIKIEYFEIK